MPIFPPDLMDPNDNLPMFVTTPATGPSYNYGNLSYANSSMHSLSPGSSPTTAEFPQHTHVPALSRTHSLQHLNYGDTYGQTITTRYDSAVPLPPSPVQLDAFGAESDHGRKRQRTGPPTLTPQNVSDTTDASGIKRMSRARSDSAPLGYGMGQPWGHGTRPRSGTGIGLRGRRDDIIPSLSVAGPGRSTAGIPPMLSLIPHSNSQKTPPHT